MKILKLETGDWLSRKNGEYRLRRKRLPIEDAIATVVKYLNSLSDSTERSRFHHSLRRRLPEDDFALLAAQIQMDWKTKARAGDEKWIIETMAQTLPPPFSRTDYPPLGMGLAWERLHRFAMEPVSEVTRRRFIAISGLDLTFAPDELWHFLQIHRPAKSPLREWNVTYDVLETRERGTTPPPGDIETARIWAYNEETARLSFGFYDVLGVQEVVERSERLTTFCD